MEIGIVLEGSIKDPSGGVKIIYQYANYLADNKKNHVTIYYNMNCGKIKRLRNFKMLQYYVAEKIVQIRPKWFELNSRISKKAVFAIDNNTIKKGDIIIATAVRTANLVANLNKDKGNKFYFIQDFENWGVQDDFVFQTYKLGMTNITVANWLSKIVDSKSGQTSICVSNGIDTNVFKVKRSILNRKRHSIAMQYRSSDYKGCSYALETIRILEKKYSDLKVIIFSPERKPINLPSCCEFFMNVSQEKVAEIDNSVKIFMCSSINEGFGLPGLEAMACGCVLVSTEYKGVYEYAKNGENALLSPIKDPQSMANNIVYLFENDENRIQLAKCACKTGSQSSIKTSAEKFASALLQDRHEE